LPHNERFGHDAIVDSRASWEEIFVTFYENSSNHSQMQLLSGISSVDFHA